MPRHRRHELAHATAWITPAAQQHGAALPDAVAARLGVGRRSALALLRRLEAAQWLRRSGPQRRPVWQPGAMRQVVHSYVLAGLQEDRVWAQDFAPGFVLPAAVQRMARHALTELVNNAVEHSGGRRVTVSMRQTPQQLQLLVSDDGCGLFERIAQAHGIDDARLAMFELAKGGLTSRAAQHSGQGLFFSARVGDIFDIHANGAAFQYRAGEAGPMTAGAGAAGLTGTAGAGPDAAAGRWHDTRPASAAGTSVYLAIALDTPRTLQQVLQQHALPTAPGLPRLGFDLTQVPLGLLGSGGALASRAEARRAAARLGAFRAAELDFRGIADIGHGFADELFRVFAQQHPQLQLRPQGMAPAVAAMVSAAAGVNLGVTVGATIAASAGAGADA